MTLRLCLIGAQEALEHVFGRDGGFFGRSRTCDWVLPDAECLLSSKHGRIAFLNGSYVLVDESTNGIFLDGHAVPIGRGHSILLQDGMRLRAARYLIGVALPGARADAPAAGPAHYAVPSAMPVLAPLMAREGDAEKALRDQGDWGDIWGKNSQDPLAYLEHYEHALKAQPAASPRDGSALSPLLAPSLPSAFPAVFGGHASPALHGGSADTVPGDSQMPAAPWIDPQSAHRFPGPADPMQGLGDRLRPALFAQPTASVADPAASPAPPSAALKRIPDDFDPMAALGSLSRGGHGRSAATRGPGDMPASWPTRPPAPLPGLSPGPPMPVMAAPAPAEALSPLLMADFATLGRPVAATRADTGGEDFDAYEMLKSRREERKARLLEKAGPTMAAPLPAAGPALAPAAAPPSRDMPSPPAVAAPQADAVRALFAGMGFPKAQIAPADAAAVMEDVGRMVRALADGLVLLLSARRMVKSEFRMDETAIQPEENNPFKYFKMAELALDELFLTRSGGFQRPADAATSAFDDVQQHVMLTMSAMQRSIKLLIERLSPENSAREDDNAPRIRGLGARKGKWESYVESHARMSGNLDGVTRQIIAEAFLQVQEEQARKVASKFWESKQ